MFSTRLRSSSSVSRSPASSALISAEIRSSPGAGRRRGDQLVLVGVELGHRLLDLRALGHQAGRVELALDHVRPVVKARGVLERSAHHLGDHERRVRLGEVGDELEAAVRRYAVEQLLQEAAHGRPVAVDGPRRQRRVDEVAQPAVIVAVDVDDVLDDLLAQRTVGDLEQVGDRQPGEHRGLGPQEELARPRGRARCSRTGSRRASRRGRRARPSPCR